LRIPGFRRYAREIDRLLADAAAARELRDRLEAVETALRAANAKRGLGSGEGGAVNDEEWTAHARQYEYYWINAQKKIDLLAAKPFGPIATRVLGDGRTFLGADRLYTLWQAIIGLPSAAEAVLEVGAFKGGSAKLTAEALRWSGRPLRFYVCDTFQGHAVVDPALDGRHRVGKQFSGNDAQRVAKYLKDYDFLEVVEGDIRETAARFEDQRAFGMVHIDVDVHPATQFCLEFFASRMVVGGVIVVDDYGFLTCKGVKVAVDEFVSAHRDRYRSMHLLTGQAVLTRVA
jgi:O-methyltransferase